jgi:flagellar biosynthesis chaperone FliJ
MGKVHGRVINTTVTGTVGMVTLTSINNRYKLYHNNIQQFVAQGITQTLLKMATPYITYVGTQRYVPAAWITYQQYLQVLQVAIGKQ